MPAVTITGDRVPIRAWVPAAEIEDKALAQLHNVARLPWVAHHVAVMADVHAGIGATVGSVIAMRGAVAPAAVGVDIGCGMAAVKTDLTSHDLPDDLRRLRSAIEGDIPVGFSMHDRPAWQAPGAGPLAAEGAALMARYQEVSAGLGALSGKVEKQLGTLGGGNHFIEVCLDTEDTVWLMLHSGSRNVGKTLADHHIDIARRLQHNQALPDRDLAVFLAGTTAFANYRRDLLWAQDYARFNRAVMLQLLTAVVRRFFPKVSFAPAVSCHHNYVAEEIHYDEELIVTRKGAIRAGAGELGIIPGSMGTRSYIVRGLGNPASFQSASHGAGRRMSRTEARRRFTLQDLRTQTEGVECRKDAGVIDESPLAYKDIDQVMARQADLVEVVAELRQVVCVKG